jgi:hypothetical protein
MFEHKKIGKEIALEAEIVKQANDAICRGVFAAEFRNQEFGRATGDERRRQTRFIIGNALKKKAEEFG